MLIDLSNLNKYLSSESNIIKIRNLLFDALKKDKGRYDHSISVAELSEQIAISNKLNDSKKYYFVGLIHDYCKNFDKGELSKIIMNSYGGEVFKLIPTYAYHAFACPHVLHNVFLYNDADIDNAIIYHCTGRKQMSTLEKVIFAADKIEPFRGYDSKDMIDLMLKDYKKGFIKVLEENRIFLAKKRSEINNNIFTKECYKYYLGKEQYA